MKPLTLSLFGLFFILNIANAQVNTEELSTASLSETEEVKEKLPPSFDTYTDDQQDFVYIELKDVDPYSSYKFIIANAADQPRQSGFVNPHFTGKVALKNLEEGDYFLKVYDEEGNQVNGVKVISKK